MPPEAAFDGAPLEGASTAEAPSVIAPPPLIYLAGLAAGFGLEALLPSASFPVGVRWGAGGVLLLAGASLARSFFRALTDAGTTLSPYRSSSALVTAGPYRISRNPGYLGMALVYSGIAVAAGAVWPLATLAPTVAVIDRGVILREERYLESKFGAPYRQYKRRTRRWL